MLDQKFPHGATLSWNRGQDQVQHWNEIAAWGVETFGLPGDRYITDLNVNDMTWWFRTSKDRMIFVLRNGRAQCVNVSKHELTNK